MHKIINFEDKIVKPKVELIMVKIENKTTALKISAEGEPDKFADYKYLIEAVLDMPPAAGFTYGEMKARTRIQAALTIAEGEVKKSRPTREAEKSEQKNFFHFERTDFEKLQELVKEMRWRVNHKALIEFSEDITLTPAE